MLLLRPAIGVFAWYAYSAVQRQRLVRQGTFASMQMLSSFRQPDGDSLQLETLGQPVTAIADDWVYLTGRNPKLPTDSYRPTFRHTQHVACSFSNDGDTHGSRPHSSIALFGPRAVPLLSLRQLVTERMDLRPYVEEDLTKRLAWEHAMAECRPLLADENANSAAPLVPGAYSFLIEITSIRKSSWPCCVGEKPWKRSCIDKHGQLVCKWKIRRATETLRPRRPTKNVF